ncbi:hypothetical protein NPX13_g10735 [Xylaria arbuscula]|uniref:Adenylosuccinate synthetase n=1 Tax=Xylaria arbuscula TaxID=114810 RepID=A0A9W8N403_9PEZI|nr:hypothetical protein NPX13_g10735 [Xylaria arbuscula]
MFTPAYHPNQPDNFGSRLLPSGVMSPSCMNLIGSGVIFHVPTFFSELEAAEAKGAPTVRERIFLSDRSQVDLDLYGAVDDLAGVKLDESRTGTTEQDATPSIRTNTMRSNMRIHEIFDQEAFETKLRKLANTYRERHGDALRYDVEDEIRRFREYRPKLAAFCVDAVHLIHNMQKHNVKFLVEGFDSLMLDVNYGTYPYVTRSNTGLGGVFTGLAIHPKKIDQIIGVVNAYTTREDEGIFKTENHGDTGTDMQIIERDTNTGRKRRYGWVDLVALKYSIAVNHYTSLSLSKLDILDKFPVIKLAVAYRDPETGEALENFPADPSILKKCEVVYHEMEGWQQQITHVKTFESLPEQARAYVKFIEENCGVFIAWIGTGPSRDDIISRPIPDTI